MANPQTSASGRSAVGDDDFTELLPETRRALAHRLAVAQRDGRLPGVVAAVVRDGERRWWGSRSMVEGHAPDPDTQFRIGSITKTFVAVLVMRLRDEGQLELSDPIGRYLPAVGPAVGEVTIRQLLAHTSGLSNEPPGPWWERTDGALRPELADLLMHPPLRHEPGRVFHYSNVGYGLLGALVEQLRGDDWYTVLHREVLRPLGMRRTTAVPDMPHAGGWAVHPWAEVILSEPLQQTGRMAPAGQLWSTVDDLVRWAAFLAEGDERVLAVETVLEMRESQANGDEQYGLGLLLRQAGDLPMVGHAGSMPGFLADVWIVPGTGLGVVALTNATTSAGPAFRELASDLLRIVAEREPRIPEPWRPLTSYDPEVLALTGPWYWGPAGFALRLVGEGDELELTPLTGPGGRATRLHRAEDGEGWVAEGGYWHGEPMRVVRDAEGGITHLDLATFVFTREPYPADGPVPDGVDPAGWRAEKW
ncbi:serine hydrolase [Streptacidiphilus pinicola]|uniref:Serine hydrolase n=1 Tax=Streptacidiphilus pinicola TaxID=2219663 RepID=A0A2X0K0R4_9ACTN|nr:serine hydrolase domain-containing protein [Streptacidiphilus pinicola]RAG80940.1 serine hydrolase [Streptacidiphilus pinicola]